MTSDELEERKVKWWILKQIKERLDKNPKSNTVTFLVHLLSKDPDIPPSDKQLKALTELKQDQTIDAATKDYDSDVFIVGAEEYQLTAIQPKFDEVYREHTAIFENTKDITLEAVQDQEIISNNPTTTENPPLLKERLERRFKTFIDLDNAGFFRGVADYVQVISDSPTLSKIVEEGIRGEEKQEHQKLHELMEKCNTELQDTATKLAEVIKQNNIQSAPINREIDRYNGFRVGRNSMSRYTQVNEYDALCGIVRALNEGGYTEIAQNFATINQDGRIEEFTFSPASTLLRQEINYLKERRQNTTWGSWNEILLVYLMIHDRRKFSEAIQKSNDFIKRMDFYMLVEDMARILENKMDRRPVQFIREDYKFHINRVHNYILEKLESSGSFTTPGDDQNLTKPPKQTVKLAGQNVKFNDKEATIEVGEYKSILPPFKNEHYFCRAVFKHKPRQPVDWSEIYDEMTGSYQESFGKPSKTRENWRPVYDTMVRINTRIKKDLNTQDNLFSWHEMTIIRNF